jgi:hypothetical protein
MATYHEVHYLAFHLYLPRALGEGGLATFITATDEEILPEYLMEIWKLSAQVVGATEGEPRIGLVEPKDFRTHVAKPLPGWTAVIFTTPKVEQGLEAVMVAVTFENSQSGEFQYFTLEAPVHNEGPPMVGQWDSTGRHNLGPLNTLSVESFLDVIVQQLPSRAGSRDPYLKTERSPKHGLPNRGKEEHDYPRHQYFSLPPHPIMEPDPHRTHIPGGAGVMPSSPAQEQITWKDIRLFVRSLFGKDMRIFVRFLILSPYYVPKIYREYKKMKHDKDAL